MAEKKTTKAAATKKATAEKKAATPKAAEKKATTAKTAVKKATAKKAEEVVAVSMSVENVGFKAGDVYQTLAHAEKALTVKEIAEAANITEIEVLLGAGWLLKEGKLAGNTETLELA